MSVRRLTALVLTITGLLAGTAAPSLAVLPDAPNDSFADAIKITGSDLPFEWQGNTMNATLEGGEATPDQCSTYSSTVWFTVKVATTTFLRADTMGTDGSGLDLYRGDAVDSLTLVDCGNDATDDSPDERVVWRAKAGVTYRLRVGSHDPGAVLRVRKVPPPKNDDFAKATVIDTFPRSLTTDLMNASVEVGEPVPTCASKGGNSIWYAFTLPTTKTVQVDATDTAVDTYLLVTTGSKVNALTVLNCQDDISQVGNGSRISFTAKAGKTYHVLLAGYGGKGGTVRLRFSLVTPPANDAFANAKTIPEDGSLVKGDTSTATTQTGEPLTAGDCTNEYLGSTVWYTFVATADRTYTFDAYGSWPSIALGAYTGSSLGSLTALSCGGGREVGIDATQGTRYYIQVGGYDADNGPIRVHLDRLDP